ncbi:uncharacterized protein KY384_001614 [Bacidia gigantensis]|uniref:uncharacterized protein n=1 Tax=Bacidia gigantensis TaxID=2732470 RepID=UPI001D03BFCE|nr:uncharacterized protein KY384_001614 [Bacidia gigantensis]KAG8533873.1 hypothetical protein KY384_001614 [Bacidia gigantensis]
MPTRTVVSTDKAPPPLPVYSQAIVCNGMVYCSGQVAIDPATKKFNEGGIEGRTYLNRTPVNARADQTGVQKQCLTNLSEVLTAAGSSIDNVVKISAFLTTMDNFAAFNREYEKWFGNLKPANWSMQAIV